MLWHSCIGLFVLQVMFGSTASSSLVLDKECGATYSVGSSSIPAHTVILSRNSSVDGNAQKCSLEFKLPNPIPENVGNLLAIVEHLTLPYSSSGCKEENLTFQGDSPVFDSTCGEVDKSSPRYYEFPPPGIISYSSSGKLSPNEDRNFSLTITALFENCTDQPEYFRCKNDKCIYHKLRCDHSLHCSDKSDEDWDWAKCPYQKPSFEWVKWLLVAIAVFVGIILLIIAALMCAGCVTCGALFAACFCCCANKDKWNEKTTANPTVVATYTSKSSSSRI